MVSRRVAKLSKFRLRILQASVEERAKITAKMFVSIMTLTFAAIFFIAITPTAKPKDLQLLIPVSIVAFMVFGLLVGYGYYQYAKHWFNKIYTKRDEALGHTPTKDEIKELYTWWKLDVKPSSPSVQPILPKFLNYMETRYNGTYKTPQMESKHYKLHQVLFIVLFTLNGTSALFRGDAINLVAAYMQYIAAALWLFVLIFVKPTDNPRRIAVFINRKNLAKIARMREQL